MSNLKKVLIMAGGTGGHVFPGLAVAKKMHDFGIEVHWLGTQKGLESRVVPEANFPIHYISITGLRGKGFKELLKAPFRLLVAIKQAKKIIQKINPDIVIGMGGFASGPGGIASRLLKKPLVIHEQNAKAGMTNRWLSKVAKKVLQAFPNTFPEAIQAETIGNPVRAEIANLKPPVTRFAERQSPMHLLVVGGSLGASAINELVPQALALIPEELRPKVCHQTGEKHLAATQLAYEAAGVSAELIPFISDMSSAYEPQDLVLCRAGALTISELCAVGIGAILIPYPFATDDHQTMNGNFMAEKGAAILIQQKDLTPERLAALIKDFSVNREKCFAMAKAAYALKQKDAAIKVLTACEEILS